MPREKERGGFGKTEGGFERERERPSAGGRGMTVEEAGHKGGQRVRELVEEGKEKEKKEDR